MNSRMLVAATLVSVTMLIPRTTAGAQSPRPVANVTPSEGHGGDAVYISGSGFSPFTRLTVGMACPDAFSAHPAVAWVSGPLTDRHGRFAGFRFPTLALDGKTTMTCHMYVS